MTGRPEAALHASNGTSADSDLDAESFARLAEQGFALEEYFGQYLTLLLSATSARCGAVWEHGAQGRLRLQAQRNMPLEALVASDTGDTAHESLRIKASEQSAPLISPTGGKDGTASHPVAFVPVVIDDRPVRLVEIWFVPDAEPARYSHGVKLATISAGHAARYVRAYEREQLQAQQQIWTQLNTFVHAIHSSLNPTEIAFHVANEGRRLVGCDRCSVALRFGDRVRIEAMSGIDTIDKRSNIVWRLRELCDRVLAWGEPLQFTGAKDESLPPPVLDALDGYLAESSCRFLTVLPLRDKREEGQPRLRTALVMECFESTSKPGKLVERLRVVGQHAASALYNATEYRTIPLRPLWLPLVRLRQGLGGTTRTVIACVSTAVALLLAMLIWVPYPLKMDAKGQLLPENRAWVYTPVESQVVELAPGVVPGAQVAENQSLVLMYDMQLQVRVVQLQSEIRSAQRDIEALAAQADAAAPTEQPALGSERKKREYALERKIGELRALTERQHAMEGRPGYFWLRSPLPGTILNGDFRENLLHRTVKPSEPLLRVGDKSRQWEIVLKIPQQHLGQVLLAFESDDPQAELDVDLLLVTQPTATYKGKLARGKIGSEANASKEDAEPEPMLIATVRIEGPDIAVADQLPRSLLVAGTEVHAKIRCGKQRMGYALFYGAWEFLYDKVVFFF